MSTLIFDIETVGEEWSSLDVPTQKALTRWIDNQGRSSAEREALYEQVRTGLALSPLTGSIVALGIYDLERGLGTVYYQGNGKESDEESGRFALKERSEADMLRLFWDGAQHYNIFVSFNGRAFDVPFLMHRSVVHGIAPTVPLLGRRYLSQQQPPYHVDLQDELTFYGAMSRRPGLHLFCRAYGIKSPKEAVDGGDVGRLFRQKQFRGIARYSALDLTAVTQLYEKWRELLAPGEFRDGIDI